MRATGAEPPRVPGPAAPRRIIHSRSLDGDAPVGANADIPGKPRLGGRALRLACALQSEPDMHDFTRWLKLAQNGILDPLERSLLTREVSELAGPGPAPGAPEPYARRVLHASPGGEVMLASWQLGGRSAPHDHGAAHGVVVVLRGRFSERTYELSGATLRARSVKALAAGLATRVRPGLVHDMESLDEGITLHVYAPGIEEMRVYDEPRRATWLVAGASGAWIPQGSSHVRAREAWR